MSIENTEKPNNDKSKPRDTSTNASLPGKDEFPWYRKLHWQIVIGMFLGLAYGLLASYLGWGDFTARWIKPWGTIFINMLKFIAVPMILVSLILGVASLEDLTRLSRIGGKTIAYYLVTTVIAVVIGLILVNLVKPGDTMPEDIRKQLAETYSGKVEESSKTASDYKKSGPLQPLVDMVPDNFFNAASDNRNMLQVVFIAIVAGIGLVKTHRSRTGIIKNLLEGANETILKIVDLIMIVAPIGVFAQISTVITELAGRDPAQAVKILQSMGFYVVLVLVGLSIQIFAVYCSLIRFLTPVSIAKFFRSIQPMQLIGFSTSSSAATLPVTMECCEKNLGVAEEISSFTLPVGATINMDGTSLYQAISVVFIAQIFNMDLTLWDQLTIIITTTLSSIGTAGVPGAGVVMLIIVLQAINVPVEGIALIMGVERIIDMFRTVANITGDAAVTVVVANSEGKLNPPEGEIV